MDLNNKYVMSVIVGVVAAGAYYMGVLDIAGLKALFTSVPTPPVSGV